MILTCDVDGVIAGGEFIPEWERYPERYLSLPLLEEDIPHQIHKLAAKHSLYLLSSRKFPNALDYTRLWLNQSGFSLTDFCGVLVGLGAKEKVMVAQALHSNLHFDDDFRVASITPLCMGVLIRHDQAASHYPWSERAVATGWPYLRNWNDITKFTELTSSRGFTHALLSVGTYGTTNGAAMGVAPVDAGRVERGSPPDGTLEVLRSLDEV